METYSHSTKTSFSEVDLKESHTAKNSHLVIVTDDYAVPLAISFLKSKLSENVDNCLTLIYSVTQQFQQPLFKSELEGLERRFSHQLLVYYLFMDESFMTYYTEKSQQTFEVVINSNIRRFMEFIVFGKEELVELASVQLRFLGIKEDQISIQVV